MKTFRLIGVVVFGIILLANFFACSSEPIVPEVTVEMGKVDYFAKNMDFDSSAGEKTFSFNSNVEWTISVAPTMNGETWCTVTPSSGKDGSNTIVVKVQENTGYDDRNVVLTLTAGSTLTKTITVTQKQKDALLLTTNKFEMEPQGGKIYVEVKANVEYEVIVPEAYKYWISLDSKSRGLTTSTVAFDIAETEEYDKRECEIIFKSGNLSETVHVYQTGQEILLLTKNEYPVTDKGETIAVEVKSNFTFDVQMPDVDWVVDEYKSRGVSSHTLYYTILANETYDSREAEIIFYDKNSSIKDTLKIIQAQKEVIIIGKKEYEVKAEGETIEVELESNVDFDISIENDWIELVKSQSARALASYTLYFQISENESKEERSSHIYIADKDKKTTETFTIIQEGKDENIPYLKFTADSKQSLTMSKAVATLEYSVNNSSEWKELGINTIDFGGELGCLRIRGNNLMGTGANYNNYSYVIFENNAKVSCTGDIRTLIDYKNYKLANTDNACFYGLFNNCVILTTAPELPAKTLADECYSHMFYNCKSLTTSPELPATTLADECYSQMFTGCSSLTTAPELPATTLADYCYFNMFAGCSSLTTAPELPATTLADYCYTRMFEECTSLTIVPELPANELTEHCYSIMFSGCTSLTTVPKLQAEKLAYGCYSEMFKKCTSLTTAPELPAKNLVQRCYREMFAGCSSLTAAPELPAITLADYCYYGMFSDCLSLTTAPELPAKFLMNNCYDRMFFNCTKLNNIVMLATDISASDCLTYWTYNVASKGTFTKAKEMTSLSEGKDGIPKDWTVIDKE